MSRETDIAELARTLATARELPEELPAGVIVLVRRREAIVPYAGGTLSMRWVPDDGVPFALHRAERLSDRELLRVDGHVLLVRDAIALLDGVWREQRLLTRLVDICILRAELSRAPARPTDADVQTTVDRLRATHGLATADATRRWLAERGWTEDDLVRHATEQAAILLLRERVVGDHVAAALDAAAREVMLAERFAAWLADRRAAAEIQWGWGPADL